MANFIRLSNRTSVNLDNICMVHLDQHGQLVVTFTSGDSPIFVGEEQQVLQPRVGLTEAREPVVRPPGKAISR